MIDRHGAGQDVDRPDDPRIADYARVGDPAWLEAAGLFVAEGRLVVRRVLTLPRFRILSILTTPTAFEALATEQDGPTPATEQHGSTLVAEQHGGTLATEQHGSTRPTEQHGSTQAFPIFVASQSIVNEITGFDFHRGCLALVRRPDEPGIGEITHGRRILVMEGVGNPDNVGGLFRVAAAFGVSGTLLDPTTADPFYRKAVRTSMGGTLTVPHACLRPWPDALAMLRDLGFIIVALSPSGATSIKEVAAMDFRRIAVLVGSEGRGLTEDALAAADVVTRIPMPGGVDSLNVTVAAGIAFSHLS